MSKKPQKFVGSISNAEHIAATLELNIPHIFVLDYEELWLLAGDKDYRVFEVLRVATGDRERIEGGWQETLEQIRRPNVESFAIVHNHPSGDHAFSLADFLFFYDLLIASHALNVEFRDFVIVARNQDTFFSARASGLLEDMDQMRALMMKILESPIQLRHVVKIDPVRGEVFIDRSGKKPNHKANRRPPGR